MKTHILSIAGTLILIVALIILCFIAYGQVVDSTGTGLARWVAPLFGAIGGFIYELVALHGNIEWPHVTQEDEAPKEGFPHARVGFMFDLGILARMFLGAFAAVAVLWLLPVETGVKAVAVALIAGLSATAVWRSLQDRLLAQLNAQVVSQVDQMLQEVQSTAAALEAEAKLGTTAPLVATGAVTISNISRMRGQLQAMQVITRR